MSLSLVKKFTPGIFGKFLILMAVTAIAISLMLGIYWRQVAQPQFRNEFRNHIDFYRTLLTQELGDPPDRKKSAEIAEKLHIGIRFESNENENSTWQTTLFPQTFEANQVNKIRHGQSLTATPLQSGRLLFFIRLRQEIETVHILAVVGIVGLALFIAWLVSRYLLKPIQKLQAGMAAIESGKLNFRLAGRGNDEFAGLERSFNSMTQNLETMIDDRDRLLADVSHELRSPLTRMKVALELTKDKKTAKVLRGEITEIQAIIAALLDTERMAAGANFEQIEVVNLISELCRENKVQFTAAVAQVKVSGGREKLRIALRNIIANAIQHGARPVNVYCETIPHFVVLRIADAGKGVQPQEAEKIFLPFYRSSSARRRGYGLGLYMAKRIIESMRGQITLLASKSGAVIEIRLPLVA